jgi:hypothetical protein
MVQFHETVMGRRFFEHQLPELIGAIKTVGKELGEWNRDIKETLQQPHPIPPAAVEQEKPVEARVTYFEIMDKNFTGVMARIADPNASFSWTFANFDPEEYRPGQSDQGSHDGYPFASEDSLFSNQEEVFTFPCLEAAVQFYEKAGYRRYSF